MGPFSKLIAAVIGVAIMIVHDKLGFDLTGQQEMLAELAIGVLTAWGVYGFRNKGAS